MPSNNNLFKQLKNIVSERNPKKLEDLIKKNKHHIKTLSDSEQNYVIHYLVKAGWSQGLIIYLYLVKLSPTEINQKNRDGDTALYLCSKLPGEEQSHSAQIANLLINHEAEFNLKDTSKDASWRKALFLAVKNGNFHLTEYYFALGLNPNELDPYDFPLIFTALGTGSAELFSVFVSAGVNIGTLFPTGDSVITRAIYSAQQPEKWLTMLRQNHSDLLTKFSHTSKQILIEEKLLPQALQNAAVFIDPKEILDLLPPLINKIAEANKPVMHPAGLLCLLQKLKEIDPNHANSYHLEILKNYIDLYFRRHGNNDSYKKSIIFYIVLLLKSGFPFDNTLLDELFHKNNTRLLKKNAIFPAFKEYVGEVKDDLATQWVDRITKGEWIKNPDIVLLLSLMPPAFFFESRLCHYKYPFDVVDFAINFFLKHHQSFSKDNVLINFLKNLRQAGNSINKNHLEKIMETRLSSLTAAFKQAFFPFSYENQVRGFLGKMGYQWKNTLISDLTDKQWQILVKRWTTGQQFFRKKLRQEVNQRIFGTKHLDSMLDQVNKHLSALNTFGFDSATLDRLKNWLSTSHPFTLTTSHYVTTIDTLTSIFDSGVLLSSNGRKDCAIKAAGASGFATGEDQEFGDNQLVCSAPLSIWAENNYFATIELDLASLPPEVRQDGIFIKLIDWAKIGDRKEDVIALTNNIRWFPHQRLNVFGYQIELNYTGIPEQLDPDKVYIYCDSNQIYLIGKRPDGTVCNLPIPNNVFERYSKKIHQILNNPGQPLTIEIREKLITFAEQHGFPRFSYTVEHKLTDGQTELTVAVPGNLEVQYGLDDLFRFPKLHIFMILEYLPKDHPFITNIQKYFLNLGNKVTDHLAQIALKLARYMEIDFLGRLTLSLGYLNQITFLKSKRTIKFTPLLNALNTGDIHYLEQFLKQESLLAHSPFFAKEVLRLVESKPFYPDVYTCLLKHALPGLYRSVQQTYQCQSEYKNVELSSELISLCIHGAYVYEKHFSKPYRDAHLCRDDLKLDNLPRPNHGLAHSLRCSIYLKFVIRYFSKFAKDANFRRFCNTLSADTLQILPIAMLFTATGRESEVTHIINRGAYECYKQASAKNFLTYARLINMPPNEASLFAEIIEFFADPEHRAKMAKENPTAYYLVIIILFTHKLDLMRCYSLDRYQQAVADGHDFLVGPSAEQSNALMQLFQLVDGMLETTGDRRVTGYKTGSGLVEINVDYQHELFLETSTNPILCLRRCEMAVNKIFPAKPNDYLGEKYEAIPNKLTF